MSYLNNKVLDYGLWYIAGHANRLVLTVDEIIVYDQIAPAGAIIGAVVPVLVGPENGDVEGRKITVQAIDNGLVEEDGTPAFWSLLDDNLAEVLICGPIANPLPVVTGNIFTLTEIMITFPGLVPATPLMGK